MSDSRQVIGVLQDARELVRDDWGCSNLDVPFETAHGSMCASVAICSGRHAEIVQLEAHAAFLRGAGVTVPRNRENIYQAVYDFNDAQTSRISVLAAFDRAIATVEAGSEATDALTDDVAVALEPALVLA